MIEDPSLVTSDFRIQRIDNFNKPVNDKGILTCSAEVTARLNSMQLSYLGPVVEDFQRNDIDWCGRSSLGIIGRPFYPRKIGVSNGIASITGVFSCFVPGITSPFDQLSVGDKIGRLLVSKSAFEITDKYELEKMRFSKGGSELNLPTGSRIVDLGKVKDDKGRKIFGDSKLGTFGIELPLVSAFADYNHKLLKSPEFVRKVIGEGRNAISRLTKWEFFDPNEDYFVNPRNFALFGSNLSLSGVSALIQEPLKKQGLIHLNARFLDGGRSGGKSNMIKNHITGQEYANLKYLELFNLNNKRVSIKNGKIYLIIGDKYPEGRSDIALFSGCDLSKKTNDDLIDVKLSKFVLNQLGENNRSDKPYSMIIFNGKIYEVPWESCHEHQLGTIEFFKDTCRVIDLESKDSSKYIGLIAFARSLKEAFGNEEESRFAFFDAMPDKKVLNFLINKGIKQIVIGDMQRKEDIHKSNEPVSKKKDYRDSMEVIDAYTLTGSEADLGLKLHRVRGRKMETYKHMFWGESKTFDKLEKNIDIVITVYGGAGSDPEAAYGTYMKLFKALNKIPGLKGRIAVSTGGGPGTMEGVFRAARECGILTIGVAANLGPNEKASQNPDLGTKFEGSSRPERQSILSKGGTIFHADITGKAGPGTLGETIEEMNATSLFERQLTPMFLLGNDNDAKFKPIIEEIIEIIQTEGLHKGNTNFKDLFVFCDTPEDLINNQVEFLTDPDTWYKKRKIKEEFRKRGQNAPSKPGSIGFPVNGKIG